MSHLDRSSIAIIAIVLLLGIPFVVFASAPTPSVVEDPETKQPLVFSTLTPIPTPVPTAAPTVKPEPTPTPERSYGAANRGLIRFSRYDPALGGVNCARFVNGECVSNMASGLDWRDWMDVACACPPEWPFWTKVTLIEHDRSCYCLDRGGKIKFIDGIPYVDFLSETAFLPYGSVHLAEIELPKE